MFMEERDSISQELINYINLYCSQFYNELERKASSHYIASAKLEGFSQTNVSRLRDGLRRMQTKDESVLKLLEDGYATFARNTAARIYKDHRKELNLNYCPECKGLARTPKARQCRYCGHDWH
ncbi:MAG: hypothetical protein Roseis2KO_30250 [Roseivirga sp.]